MPEDGKKAVSKERQSMTEKPTKEQERSAAVALAKWLGTSEYPANRLQGFYRESPELKAIVQSVETGKLSGVKALCTNHSDIISYRVDADANVVKELYWQLVSTEINVDGETRKLNVFWDKKCLKDGFDWENGFAQAICSAAVVVAALVTPDLMRAILSDACN